MDVSVFNTKDKSDEGSWMPILDFDWETPVGADILVLGPDSREAVAIIDEEESFNQRRIAESFAGNKKAKAEAEGEVSVDKAIRKAVRLTLGWRNIEWEGKEFPFTPENATKLYTKVSHIRVQVLNYYRDRSTFTTPEYANWRARFGKDSSLTPPAREEALSEKH